MSAFIKRLTGILITGTILTLGVILGHKLWVQYMDSPWTRDGRVRADIVNVTSDVSGFIVDVLVKDNQYVRKGDVLFTVDAERYKFKLAETQANLDRSKIILEIKNGQFKRRAQVDDQVISQELREDSNLYAVSARAEYNEAIAKRQLAKLNLERSVVRSPVDGWVSNLIVRPGDYAEVGTPKLAIIDQNSFWVYGYFEENKIKLIRIGDKAEIRVLGSDKLLNGYVQSIAHGITDRDNPTDVKLLANVNPTFNWVRLAQRIPVRIHLDPLPKDLILVAGMTCTVIIKS